VIHAARLLLAVLALFAAGAISGCAFLIISLRDHLMRTSLLLLPAYQPSFRFLARVVSHYCDGYCWKCGARGPTAADLKERDL